jgi:hypothetical protein
VFVQCTASSNLYIEHRNKQQARAITPCLSCSQRVHNDRSYFCSISAMFPPPQLGRPARVRMCRERQADKAGEKQHSRSSISRADGAKEALRTISARPKCTVVHCDAHLGGQTILHAPWST